MTTSKPTSGFPPQVLAMGTPAPQFTDMQFGWVGYPSLEISTTSDGGEHWEELDLHTLPEGVEQIQFINRSVGWSLSKGDEDFFSQWCNKTTDGGKTWMQLIPAIT